MKKIIAGIVPVMLVLASCSGGKDYTKQIHDPFLYCSTVKKLNDIVLENNFPPMIAARNYAYANIAAYECIAAEDKNYTSLAGQIHGLKSIPKPTDAKKVDYPFAALLAFCKVGNAVTFPEGSMDEYVNALKKKVKEADMPSVVFENSLE